MSKGRKTALFAFSAADRREARLWLASMEEQGWELVRVKGRRFPRAVFAPLERDDLRYDVDIADNFLKDIDRQAEYDQFLSDAGWDRVGQANGLKVYKSKPGFSPAPIQTDPELERKRYWKEAFMPSLVTLLIVLAVAVLVWFGLNLNGPFHLYYLLRSNGMIFFWLVDLLVLALCIGASVWELWKGRRGAETPPSPARIRRARLRGAFFSSISLLMPLAPIPMYIGLLQNFSIPAPSDETVRSWPVALAEDFGVENASTYGLVQADSALLHSVLIRSWFPVDDTSGRLTEERFDCTYSWVADLVVSGLLNDEDDYTPAELGFDESYQDGENNLLLRQGNTVVRLEAPFDLTTGTALAVLRDRLEWEG